MNIAEERQQAERAETERSVEASRREAEEEARRAEAEEREAREQVDANDRAARLRHYEARRRQLERIERQWGLATTRGPQAQLDLAWRLLQQQNERHQHSRDEWYTNPQLSLEDRARILELQQARDAIEQRAREVVERNKREAAERGARTWLR